MKNNEQPWSTAQLKEFTRKYSRRTSLVNSLCGIGHLLFGMSLGFSIIILIILWLKGQTASYPGGGFLNALIGSGVVTIVLDFIKEALANPLTKEIGPDMQKGLLTLWKENYSSLNYFENRRIKNIFEQWTNKDTPSIEDLAWTITMLCDKEQDAQIAPEIKAYIDSLEGGKTIEHCKKSKYFKWL